MPASAGEWCSGEYVYLVKREVIARAPARIDFGGGWTDVPPYCDREGGFVCNVAITRHSSVRMATLAGAATPEVVTERDPDRLLVNAALRHAHVADARVALHNDFPVGA